MTATLERQAFLEARKGKIGATDLSALAGVHPWKSAAQVYAELKGLCEPEEETAVMRRGLALEPYVASLWLEHRGLDPYGLQKVAGPIQHPTHEFLIVSPDYRYCHSDDQSVYLEAKTHAPFVAATYGPPESDQAPAHEIIQCTWQLHVAHLVEPFPPERVELAVLFGVDDFRCLQVDYDEEFGQELEDMAVAWWREYVETDTPPPIGGSEADSRLLGRLYAEDNAGVCYATAEIEERITLLRQARENRKLWEDTETGLENAIKSYMAENATLMSAAGKITWRLAAPPTQWKGVAQSLAERFGVPARELEALCDLHKGTASRRFLLPKGW